MKDRLSEIISRKSKDIHKNEYTDFSLDGKKFKKVAKPESISTGIYKVVYRVKGDLEVGTYENLSRSIGKNKTVVNVKKVVISQGAGFQTIEASFQNDDQIDLFWIPAIIFTAVAGTVTWFSLDKVEAVIDDVPKATNSITMLVAVIGAVILLVKVLK